MERAKLCGFLILILSLPGIGSSLEAPVLWSYDFGDTANSIALDSTGSIMAGGQGKQISFFNNTELNWTFQCYYPVKDIAISEDGKKIFVADRWMVYRLNETGGLVWSMKIGEPYRIDSTLEGDKIIVGSMDKKGYLIDDSGSSIWTIDFSAPVIGASISPDGKKIVLGTTNGKISLFSDTKQKIWDSDLNTIINIIDINRDEVLVGAGSLKFLKGGEIDGSYLGLTGVSAIDVSSDGTTILVGSLGGDLAAIGSDRKSIWKNNLGEGIVDVSSSSDGSRIGVVSGSKIYLLSSPEEEVIIQEPGSVVAPSPGPLPGGEPVGNVQVNIISPWDGQKVYGIVEVLANFSSQGIMTAVYIDGNYACTLPCQWDTAGAEPGEHEITVRALSSALQVTGEDKITVYVLKRPSVKQSVIVREEISSGDTDDVIVSIKEFYQKYKKLIFLVVLGIIIMGVYEARKKKKEGDEYRYRGF